MEEYTQITLDEWTQWKEDIRRKLAETANNFVYIGYRLKQIRDSGMFGGAADVFEFAQNEYGLGMSTVSRFIAINEKYSEGGNSLELKEEFRNFSSSKLSEMLTLPDNEIQMITERTTIKAIRELKKFNAENPEAVQAEEKTAVAEEGPERTPLEKCLIDFFELRKEMLNNVMKCLETDPPEYKQAAELMASSGHSFHKKGIVFLFLYEWSEGVKYKLMTEAEPGYMNWPSFLNIIYGIYGTCNMANVWEDFYGKEEQEKELEEKATPIQSNQGSEPVATSQQKEEIGVEEEHEKKTETALQEPIEQEMAERGSVENTEKSVEMEQNAGNARDDESEEGTAGSIREMDRDGRKEAAADTKDSRGSQKAEEGAIEDVLVEIEMDPEQEEPLNVEFDTEELMKELDGDVIDSEAGYLKGDEEPEAGEIAQTQTEEQTGSGRYEEIIEQLIEKTAKQAERISNALHEGRKELSEYREIRGWVNILAADLEQLTKFVDLSTPEDDFDY